MRSNTRETMPTRENGESSAERLIPQALTNAAATFVDSVKLSSVSETVRRGRRVVLKRRNPYSEQLADLGNLYFRISGIPIRFWSKVEDWRRWEAECFQMLHQKSLPATTRHADDLLVFLLDIAAIAPSQKWLPFALRFLNAYGNLDVIAELKDQLSLPSGMAWIWWGVRTSFANPAKVKNRLAKLRDLAGHLGYYRTVATKRARQRRRASMSCHEISPGIPRARSRTRAISDRPKDASPGMPGRLPTKR